jgi:hypothetical protein
MVLRRGSKDGIASNKTIRYNPTRNRTIPNQVQVLYSHPRTGETYCETVSMDRNKRWEILNNIELEPNASVHTKKVERKERNREMKQNQFRDQSLNKSKHSKRQKHKEEVLIKRHHRSEKRAHERTKEDNLRVTMDAYTHITQNGHLCEGKRIHMEEEQYNLFNWVHENKDMRESGYQLDVTQIQLAPSKDALARGYGFSRAKRDGFDRGKSRSLNAKALEC